MKKEQLFIYSIEVVNSDGYVDIYRCVAGPRARSNCRKIANGYAN